ncbi:MAG: DUF3887 domain-containing protein [Christensenella sp.]|nr:DUF3887 domain-containing protein [Christensenella sp.]
MKKQIKTILSAALILVLGLSLIGCAANKLPEGFVEEDVGTAAEEIVGLATAGDYDSIILSLRDDLKSSVTADQLKEGWAATYEKAGAFDSITKTVFSSTKDKTTGEEYAVVQVMAKHENANLVYTLSFDKDLMLVGLYLK